MAAFNIRGRTIHSELDIHPSATGELIYGPISPMRYQDLRTRFSNVKLLIADEVDFYNLRFYLFNCVYGKIADILSFLVILFRCQWFQT